MVIVEYYLMLRFQQQNVYNYHQMLYLLMIMLNDQSMMMMMSNYELPLLRLFDNENLIVYRGYNQVEQLCFWV
jgi:hypothetical protein